MRFLKFLTVVALIGGAAAFLLAATPGTKTAPLPARNGPTLQAAKLWGYQLQGARAELVPADIDLIVIDHAHESSATEFLSAREVAAFRNRTVGPPRIVLAYMSIGEAERYRFYWRKWWRSPIFLGLVRPTWLARENKDWKGNYLVRFWQAGWQKLIFNPAPTQLDMLQQRWLGASQPYIDKILEAGFDGVYLDRVDVFGEWEKSRPGAEAEMSRFVTELSAYAKARKPGFLVVPQNGEELAARAEYRRAIDGLAKEDLLFGSESAEQPNERDETKRSIEFLRKVQGDGKPVFVVEYLKDASKRQIARTRTSELGFAVTFAERELNRPPEPVPALPTVATPTPAIPKTQR